MTAEHKLKISASLAGRKLSDEHKANLRKAHLGKTLTEDHKRKLSAAHSGVPLSSDHRAALSVAQSRVKRSLSPELREAISSSNRRRLGSNHPRWIVDRTTLARVSQRRTKTDVTWSSHVRLRFPNCVFSDGSYGECRGRLESHHIEPIAVNSKLRFDDDNGVTLCVGHHPRKQSEAMAMAPIFKEIVAAARKDF